MLEKISNISQIKILEYYFAIDFLTRKNFKKRYKPKQKNVCYGIYAFNVETSKVEIITAGTTIIASGGAGQVYLHTSNPRASLSAYFKSSYCYGGWCCYGL